MRPGRSAVIGARGWALRAGAAAARARHAAHLHSSAEAVSRHLEVAVGSWQAATGYCSTTRASSARTACNSATWASIPARRARSSARCARMGRGPGRNGRQVGDLPQPQPEQLGALDEPQPIHRVLLVLAVAGGGPLRRRKQPQALVVPHGGGAQAALGAQVKHGQALGLAWPGRLGEVQPAIGVPAGAAFPRNRRLPRRSAKLLPAVQLAHWNAETGGKELKTRGGGLVRPPARILVYDRSGP